MKELSAWPTIERAYLDMAGPAPLVDASDDPRAVNQGYLNAAPEGVDARCAWDFDGGDGAGQRLVDLERGWTFDHEDLVDHAATLAHGTILDADRGHGTSVLGELCAVDNTIGCVGIVPNLASVIGTSFQGSTRPDAIVAVLPQMVFGDVLLIEAQVWAHPGTNNLLGPIEIYDAEYEVLRLATALGIVVVEAGGNGTNNGSAPPMAMNTWTDDAGRRLLWPDPSNPDFRDSGAIIVTAATSTTPRMRLAYGPHGLRIDCHAWGQNIDTCDSNAMAATRRGARSGVAGLSPELRTALGAEMAALEGGMQALAPAFAPAEASGHHHH
jgi:serine protease